MRDVLTPEERAALSEVLQQGFTYLRAIRIKKRVIALNILVCTYLANVIFSPQRIVDSVDLHSAAITEADLLSFLYFRGMFGIVLVVLYNLSYWKDYYFFPVSLGMLIIAAALFGYDFHSFISFAKSEAFARVTIITLCRLVVLYLIFSIVMDASKEQ
jgi:hypothetical protein